MTTTKIPPVFAAPHAGRLPLASAFVKQPADSIQPDDFVLLSGRIYRVAGVQPFSKDQRKFKLVLHPVAGGRIEAHWYWGRQWIPVYREVQP